MKIMKFQVKRFIKIELDRMANERMQLYFKHVVLLVYNAVHDEELRIQITNCLQSNACRPSDLISDLNDVRWTLF